MPVVVDEYAKAGMTPDTSCRIHAMCSLATGTWPVEQVPGISGPAASVSCSNCTGPFNECELVA